MSSGPNRLINSNNTAAKGSESTLSKNLLNANEVAKQSDKKNGKKEKKSK